MEWQIWWATTSPAAQCSAKTLLQRLLINPAGRCHHLPLLEPVPLTLTLAIAQAQVILTAQEGGSVADGVVNSDQDLGVVYLKSLQVGRKMQPMETACGLQDRKGWHVHGDSLSAEAAHEYIRFGTGHR